VHLREDSMPAAAVRRVAPPPFTIGRSVHDADMAAAVGADVDYVIAGSVWATASKLPGHPLLGPEGLERVMRKAPVPVVAIGGVTVDGARLLAGLGVAGVAAIGLFILAPASADDDHGCGATPMHDVVRRIAAL
jgi:thiamine-phosphate pyrophosphorylase